ncbi:MAG: hypothetical protein ACO3NL_15590, partial [Phycisphaerales bacterium]
VTLAVTELVELCDNGIDDDGDGLIDCDDPDCKAFPGCGGAQEICDNGIDDDGDGLTDCQDPDCVGDPACVPPNDECEGAFELVDGVNAVNNLGGTTGTTQLPAECVKNSGTIIHHDVWYRYTATCSGIATMSFCEVDGGIANFDTRLAVWRPGLNGVCEDLEIVACNDDTCEALRSRVEFEVVAGETYVVQLGAFAVGQFGSGDLLVRCDEPSATEDCTNGIDDDGDGLIDCDDPDCGAFPGCVPDECSTAVALAPGVPVFINTTTATGSIEPVDDSQCPGTFLDWGTPGTNPDVWLVWTPTASGFATFSTCDATGFDTSMVLYEGSCGALTQVACNGDGTGGA